MVLFGTVMYLLRQRKERENAMFHMVSTMLLFLFATITAVVNFLSTVEELGHLATFDFRLPTTRVIYLVTLQLVDALAFIILLHRCFNIWEGNYQVVVLPALMMLGTTSVFYAQFSEYIKIQHTPVIDQNNYNTIVHDSIAFSTAALFLNIGANILLTSLIAGRLWWIRRRLQQLVPNGTFFNKYTSLIFMTLESGMMIPIALTIYAVFTIRIKEGGSGHAALTVMNALLPQIMVRSYHTIYLGLLPSDAAKHPGFRTVVDHVSCGAGHHSGPGSHKHGIPTRIKPSDVFNCPGSSISRNIPVDGY
ncbi:hypothetical protein E1B28_003523 [Marasmius oreades]|uniref:Uncharacterized protein n=1 Tax=Marasmius oreades TaxID=181124 RepID=A0A9P7UKY7_9AGAR|nr:uncharacterized protein E1B28_003523 [Marasmius oreades]KAG7086000.1 hypothetical protein E1B28_003523 [Marasmius oreades]